MLSAVQIAEAADFLYAAQIGRAPIDPLTARYPSLDIADAYAIQQANLSRRLGDGRTLVGHKIGLTSQPMQQLLGVDEPDFGYILDDMVVDRLAVPAARFCAPRAEPEVAFLLSRPLRGPGVTTDDVRAATEAVAVALEIVDSRIAGWRLTLPDTVADNASSGAVVLGDWVPYCDRMDLSGAWASLSLNGTEVDSGLGSAVLGDPAAAVAWLANALSPFGIALLPGQFVISGSFTTAAFVEAGDHVVATISGLGTVSLSFT
ncbi:2-keto-4-pentenoate hydratase [Mycobacterium sp. 852002-51163_SCH5372311]|uniref:2-keto-4-pentenoate hydratase n=1 Tax=Mycobacterium sp. 852002-51163_SCH5372311 TaxID=1834097 RepID=UPI000801E38F|nr:fumarylacetoacetate hydrolase family protein [Mycobacterium sp. 852002-51163_SCH5372311]OBF81262.1 2-keto-4-pentenoate hydratase [Mycobacterium sp. 852002-51163_SCH5372311]